MCASVPSSSPHRGDTLAVTVGFAIGGVIYVRTWRESHDHAPPDPSGALWTVPVPFNVVSGRR